MFHKAIRRLAANGCDTTYVSDAVDDANLELESCIHELSHAVVAGLPLDRDAPPLDKYDDQGLTKRIGFRIGGMNKYQQDRNEEITLAVEMQVLQALNIKYEFHEFVCGVAWKIDERDHAGEIRRAYERPATRKHAARVIRYLGHLQNTAPVHPPRTELRLGAGDVAPRPV